MPETRLWPVWMFPLFATPVLLFLWVRRRDAFKNLGFSTRNLGNHLGLGAVCGGLVLAVPPLLDSFIQASGLDQNPLFQGAGNRVLEESPLGGWTLIGILIFDPVCTQALVMGWGLQAVGKRSSPMPAVFLAAILIPLCRFDISLGSMGMGAVAAILFWRTGSLIPPILFQAGTAGAGLLLRRVYPLGATFLSFLF
ncbi:MAG: type II CAAX prenyl endopeptidase Rce1 family protein [Nitrospinaceae bacterium]